MSWRPSRWYPRVRPRTGPGGFGGRDCEREGPAGMTPARAVPCRAGNRLKAQLATGMLGLALVQLTLGLGMYRGLPGAGVAPPPVPVLHRVGGVSLFLLSLPVAVHCMFAYGVQLGDPRVAVHSLASCFFYGAFAAKVLIVRSC